MPTTCCPIRRRKKCTTSMERRDSREAWVAQQEEEEEEECLILISVSPGLDTIPITETPGLHSHSSLAAAILLLLSSQPVLEDQTTSGEFMPLRGWTLTSRNSLGALATKIWVVSLADRRTSEIMVEFPANRLRFKTPLSRKKYPLAWKKLPKGLKRK